jgi:hypothetical protein
MGKSMEGQSPFMDFLEKKSMNKQQQRQGAQLFKKGNQE